MISGRREVGLFQSLKYFKNTTPPAHVLHASMLSVFSPSECDQAARRDLKVAGLQLHD